MHRRRDHTIAPLSAEGVVTAASGTLDVAKGVVTAARSSMDAAQGVVNAAKGTLDVAKLAVNAARSSMDLAQLGVDAASGALSGYEAASSGLLNGVADMRAGRRTRLHCRDVVGKEDLCVVLTASLGMGVGRRSGGDLGGTHARHASPLRATRLRVCGEVVRPGRVVRVERVGRVLACEVCAPAAGATHAARRRTERGRKGPNKLKEDAGTRPSRGW